MNGRRQRNRRRIVTVVAGALATFGMAFAMAVASSAHPSGVNAIFGDGSVRFIAYSNSPSISWALISRSGGEVISADSW